MKTVISTGAGLVGGILGHIGRDTSAFYITGALYTRTFLELNISLSFKPSIASPCILNTRESSLQPETLRFPGSSGANIMSEMQDEQERPISHYSDEVLLLASSLAPNEGKEMPPETSSKEVKVSHDPKFSDSVSKSPGSDPSTAHAQENTTELPQPATRGLRFWLAFVPLCFVTLLAAFEATVTSTALPSIVQEVGGGDLYVWILNGYLLTR